MSIKLFLACDRGSQRVRKVFFQRRPCIEHVATNQQEMVELDASLDVVRFTLENGLLDARVFGQVHDAHKPGQERLHGDERHE